MGNTVEYGIRINVSGNQGAVSAIDQVSTSTDNLTTAAEKTGKTLAVVNGQMNDTAAIMRQNADATSLASEAARKFLDPLQREIDLFGAGRGEVERYKAAKAGLSNVVQQQAAALGAAIDAMHRDEQAARQLAAEQDRAAKAAEQFLNKLKDQVATLGMNTAQLQAHRAAQLGVSDAAAPLIQRLAEAGNGANTAGKHMQGLNFQTAGARRELIVLAHELSQGNFKRFGGSMLVLGEQTGAAGLLFSSAGLAALGLAAAVAGVGAAVIKGAEDQRAMSNALIATGNYAGLTSDSLNAMAHAATNAGGSIGEAKKAVTELAASGRFTGSQIGMIADAAVAMEHAGGQAIEKTIQAFKSLEVESTGSMLRSSETISRAAVKLDQQYHFLTEAIYEQIRALEKEGDQKAASALATETLAKVTKDRAVDMARNIGAIQRGWNGVKETIAEVVDGLGKIGMKSTAATEAAKASAKLAAFDSGLRSAGITDPEHQLTGSWAATRKKLVLDLVAAYDKLNQADAAAIEQGKRQTVQQEATLAASRIEQDNMRLGKKSVSELDDAIQKYGQDLAKIAAANPGSQLLDQDAVNEHMALIVKAHTQAAKRNDDRAQLLRDALTVEQTALESDRSVYEARDKMLEMYHSKFNLSDAEFYAGRQAARAEYVAAEAIAFAKEAALVKNAQAQARNPQEVAAAKEKYDQLVKAHRKFVDDMRNADGQDTASAEADRQRSYQGIAKATVDAGAATIKSLDDQIAKQKEHNAEIGKTKAQIELEKQAIEDKQTAQLQSDADYLRDGLAKWQLDEQSLAIYRIRLANLDAEIAKRKQISGLLADGSVAEEGAKAAQELDKFLDPTKAQAFGHSMKGAFGVAIDALGKLTSALTAYGGEQAKIQKAYANAEKERKDGAVTEAKYLSDISKLNQRNTQAQLAGYGNMASAAAGFFDEHSRGYKALMAVSQVFHAAELAMTTAELVPKAISAVLTQGQGDPYTAFGRMAAMAALVAGLGVALSGGGGGGQTVAQDRQAAQGTGTVLGSGSAKSDSVARAIQLSASNSSTQINYLSGMLTALRSIQSNITSFASEVLRTTDVTNPNVGTLNTNNGLGTTLAGGGSVAAGLLLAGPVGALVAAAASKIPAIGNLLGKIGTSVLGGKQSMDDSGITMDKSSLASILSSGVNAKTYADITTSGGWFHGDKHDTRSTSLGSDANNQFTAIIKSLSSSVRQAGALLGVSGDEFTNKLNSFVIDIGKVSLKGLSGDDIQKQLEAVFSKVGDQMAQYAVGGLQQFQQAGEGYMQTLVRVASDYAKLDASLQSIGKTFGATGVSSIAARESLIALLGGIDDFQSKTSDYASNFLTKAQQLAPVAAYVSQQLTSMNLGWVKTREQFADVVAGLDLTTTAGQQTYAALMNLESAFAATHEAIADATKSAQEIADERKDLQGQLDQLTMTSAQLLAKQRDALDDSNKALFDQVQAAQKAKDAQDAAKTSLGNFLSQMKSFATTAANLNNNLRLGNLSTLTPEQQLEEARRQFEQTSKQALAVNTTAHGQLQSIEQTFLQLSQQLNGGDAAYSSDLATVMHTNDQVADWASKQVDVAQASLDALDNSSATLTDISGTLTTISQGIQSLPASLSGQAGPDGSVTFSAVDYSGGGTSDADTVKQDLQAVRDLLATLVDEVKGRRGDAQQQTGILAKAFDDAAQQAAETVVGGVHDAMTDGAYAAANSTRQPK